MMQENVAESAKNLKRVNLQRIVKRKMDYLNVASGELRVKMLFSIFMLLIGLQKTKLGYNYFKTQAVMKSRLGYE